MKETHTIHQIHDITNKHKLSEYELLCHHNRITEIRKEIEK